MRSALSTALLLLLVPFAAGIVAASDACPPAELQTRFPEPASVAARPEVGATWMLPVWCGYPTTAIVRVDGVQYAGHLIVQHGAEPTHYLTVSALVDDLPTGVHQANVWFTHPELGHVETAFTFASPGRFVEPEEVAVERVSHDAAQETPTIPRCVLVLLCVAPPVEPPSAVAAIGLEVHDSSVFVDPQRDMRLLYPMCVPSSCGFDGYSDTVICAGGCYIPATVVARAIVCAGISGETDGQPIAPVHACAGTNGVYTTPRVI